MEELVEMYSKCTEKELAIKVQAYADYTVQPVCDVWVELLKRIKD